MIGKEGRGTSRVTEGEKKIRSKKGREIIGVGGGPAGEGARDPLLFWRGGLSTECPSLFMLFSVMVMHHCLR